jgi:hypothetical protein
VPEIGLRARWILPSLGLIVVLVAWSTPLESLRAWLLHPHRAQAEAAAAQAAASARIGWTVGAIVLALLPLALRDPERSRPIRLDPRTLWLAMIAALVLRFSASTQSLWYDEIAPLATYIAHGPGVIIGNAFTTANHPLQSLLSWCCTPLGVEPWIRLPSMLSGVAAVLGAWWIGRATREGPRLGGAMAIAMAILPAAVNAGSEARGYGLMIAASSLSTGLLLMALRFGGSWRWIAYAIVLALGVWAHFLTAMVGVGHAVVALWMLRHAPERRAAVLILRAVCCAGLLSLALWSPALPDLLRTRGQFAALRGDEPSLLGTQGLLLLWQLAGMTPLPMHKAGVDGVRAVLTGLPALALLMIGLAACVRDRALRRGLAFVAAGLPIAVLFAWLGGSWLYARFLLFAVPGTALLMAIASQHALRLAGSAPRMMSVRAIVTILPVLVIGISLAYDLGAGPRQPIREAVARVAERRTESDRVLGIGIADDVVQWYAMAYGVPIEPTGIGGERLPEAIAQTDARWIVAMYPHHRHANATPEAIARLGFQRRPLHGFVGWLDAGQGTVEVWEHAPDSP